jgi:hypothetical protein
MSTPELTPGGVDPGYQHKVAKGLDRAFARADELTLDPDHDRLVIFSDHHKGTRDGADDFLRCERAYSAALGYYLEAGYRLVALGDVEELWENDPGPVLKDYGDVLTLEAEFHAQGRYERFWGNHDDLWGQDRQVRKHLQALFPGLKVREALKLRVERDGRRLGLIFLAHGHQGTDDSERFAWLSRFFVRQVWRRIQRRTGIASTTPAGDFNLRARHDRAMFEWASHHSDRPVLIAGHTHRPVFWTSTPPLRTTRRVADIERDLQRARQDHGKTSRIPELRAELEHARAEQRNSQKAFAITPPSYFNTGCCSFGDGDVTGIEIADGEIRLVRWPDDAGQPQPKLLAAEQLETILNAVTGAQPDSPQEGQAVEVPV